MSLNSKLTLSVVANLSQAAGLAQASVPLSKVYKTALDSGIAVGQADLTYHASRTLAASASEDLDLAGILTSPLGAVLTFVKIKGLIIVAAATNVNNVIVGAAAANPWATLLNAAGTLTVRPGATIAAFAGEADAAGYAVTPGTGDLLKFANSAGVTPVTWDMIIIGTSA